MIRSWRCNSTVVWPVLSAVAPWPGRTLYAKKPRFATETRLVLVLQPEFMAMCSPPPMAAAGALLVAPAPHRPGKDLCGRGWARPDQTPEQPAQFGHRVRQQLQPQSESDCGWRS